MRARGAPLLRAVQSRVQCPRRTPLRLAVANWCRMRAATSMESSGTSGNAFRGAPAPGTQGVVHGVEGHLCPLDISSALSAFRSLLVDEGRGRDQSQQLDPRDYHESTGVTLSRYVQWMGPPSGDEDVSGDQDTCQYQRVYLPVNQVQAIMRLRVCNWPLEVYRNTARVRSERVCRKC